MRILRVAQPCVGKEEAEAAKNAVLSGRYVSGANVENLEREFAKYIGVKYAVAVNSGTSALHLSLCVLGLRPKDEVIVPPLTFFSTISAILYQGATPVFADIDPESYCIDTEDIKKRLSKRTKAVIPVHLYGNSADMESIMTLAGEHGLRVIEDAAQAHGTEYNGRKVGSFGDIGIFSFFATKHMTTGEGGMMVTDNREWADMGKVIRNHGMTDRDHHDYIGYNYRMNEIAAAIGSVQLKKLESLNKRRIDKSLYLIRRLEEKNIPWLRTPVLKGHIRHTFFWCPIFVCVDKLGMSLDSLIELLREKGVETRHRYRAPLYKQKALSGIKGMDYGNVKLKNAEAVAGNVIGLPNHACLGKKDLDRIISVIAEI